MPKPTKTLDPAAKMRAWRANQSAESRQLAADRAAARAAAARRLARAHPRKYEQLYAEECAARGLPLPANDRRRRAS